MSGKRNSNLKFSRKYEEGHRYAYGIAIAISIAIVALIVFVSVMDGFGKTNYYLKDARVCGAKVEEKSTNDGKYYVRVSLTENAPGQYISTDSLWVEVKNDFYSGHVFNDSVGVLLGNYDVFKKKLVGSGQKFDKSTWGVEEVYDTLEVAKQENPQKTYKAKAQVAKRKVTQSGDAFLVLAAEDRTMTVKVSREMHDKAEVGKEVECEFESIGDLVKIKQVIG